MCPRPDSSVCPLYRCSRRLDQCAKMQDLGQTIFVGPSRAEDPLEPESVKRHSETVRLGFSFPDSDRTASIRQVKDHRKPVVTEARPKAGTPVSAAIKVECRFGCFLDHPSLASPYRSAHTNVGRPIRLFFTLSHSKRKWTAIRPSRERHGELSRHQTESEAIVRQTGTSIARANSQARPFQASLGFSSVLEEHAIAQSARAPTTRGGKHNRKIPVDQPASSRRSREKALKINCTQLRDADVARTLYLLNSIR
jgi:hypothetical protein